MANYNIKLFVHGVPNGQSVWGNPNPNAESHYIESFYGRQSSVSTQMLIEVIRMGNDTNCYYTYLKTDNLQEKGGRTGGYFALTLRINYYYTDVQNIYNLLEAAFNKYILGTILNSTDGGYRFQVGKLEEEDSALGNLEKELRHYLMQFSTNQDFVSLVGFKNNGQEACGTIHLLEASPKIVEEHVKTKGKISVSMLYPSAKEDQLRSEVEANAQRRMSEIRQQAENDVTKARQQASAEIEKVLREKEASLRASMEELQSAKKYKGLYKESLQELEKTKKAIAEIERSLSGLNITAEGESPSSNHLANKGKSGMKSLLPLLNLLLTLFLVVLLIPRSCSRDEAKDHDVPNAMVESVINETLGQEQQHVEETPPTEETSSPMPEEEPLPTPKEEPTEEADVRELFKEARIDIQGIGHNKPMKMGHVYKITLLNADADLKGKWQSKDFTIKSNDSIVPKRTGQCVIQYVINGMVAKERTITVH